ncbi:hypothetical protein [Spirosoma endophyticum]|uniref:Uncharacterized protein n=1 Tax=Spirosoma endophyticum TaxID=662367 RepID=A0A1I2F9U4_9BACT|nr:hypothetical protein [Spirosoma endophyticum]SFF02224.1 hypothetical protein SAMN05216167_12518 [Spirosoma endophyticum]
MEEEKLKSISKEIQNINEVLAVKHGEIALRDIIENEGKRQVKSIFSSRIEEMSDEYYKILENLSDLENKIKRYLDKERREQIVQEYRSLMRKYLYLLSVKLSEKDYERIDSKIGGLGSAKPRALLAYYYSILNIIKKYGSSALCPIVLDEPDQQGQDDLNMPIILNFIKENKPHNSQLILGLQDTMGLNFEGSVFEIKEKFSVLTEDDFESVQIEITPLINKVIVINNDLFGSI